MRHTFEGPSKPQSTKAPPPTPTRIPAPATNGHLGSPIPTTKPYLKSRSNAANPKASPELKGKGKGKATAWESDDDDDDDAYVTSNDFAETPERRKSDTNGAFRGAGDNDDEELYG